MIKPQFDPSAIPFIAEKEELCYSLQVDDTAYELSVLSMGNPHAIMVVKNLDTIPLEKIGHALSTHSKFPEEVNIGFMQVMSRKKIGLRVYERGVGETLACGSNASAAVVSGIRLGLLDTRVEVCFKEGSLHIQWPEPTGPVYMRGSAHTSFIGRFRI
jgi:diaminopimelate epimerase